MCIRDRNMSNVERIEIVKGAAASLYGSNAVGGVVNIIGKVPAEPWTCLLYTSNPLTYFFHSPILHHFCGQ